MTRYVRAIAALALAAAAVCGLVDTHGGRATDDSVVASRIGFEWDPSSRP